jgi:hypothetical protein
MKMYTEMAGPQCIASCSERGFQAPFALDVANKHAANARSCAVVLVAWLQPGAPEKSAKRRN